MSNCVLCHYFRHLTVTRLRVISCSLSLSIRLSSSDVLVHIKSVCTLWCTALFSRFLNAATSFGLTVSLEKTEVMFQPADSRQHTTGNSHWGDSLSCHREFLLPRLHNAVLWHEHWCRHYFSNRQSQSIFWQTLRTSLEWPRHTSGNKIAT